MRRGVAVLALAALAFLGMADAGEAGGAKKPRLGLRATPRMAFFPASVLVAAQLVGGTDLEDYYCPGLEWDWGDGSRSFREGDCPPYEAGASIERFFSARHDYRQPGGYTVRLSLRQASRTVAVASVAVFIHGPSASADAF